MVPATIDVEHVTVTGNCDSSALWPLATLHVSGFDVMLRRPHVSLITGDVYEMVYVFDI